MRYFVEVVSPGEAGTRHEVSDGAGTLGTGPGDIVRLPAGSIVGPAALRLSVNARGVEVSARDSACSFAYQGQTHTSALVKWGDELYLGATRLHLVAEEGKKKGASPILIVVGIFVLVFVAGGLHKLTEPGFRLGPAPEPPALSAGAAVCRASSPEAAHVRAQEAEALARSKEERYPFSRPDGVRAMQHYREASKCFETAGLLSEKKRVEAALEAWSETLQRDLRDLRLRLDMALRDQDTARALSAARALESMLSAASEVPAGDSSEGYSRWLSSTKRQLQARASNKN